MRCCGPWKTKPNEVTASHGCSSANFLQDISANPINRAILARWSQLDLPNAWLVAGCLFQTVWNLQAGRSPESCIKDYDLFYFDASDLSAEGEAWVQAHADSVLGDLGVSIEVANQGRVHLWYPDYFGQPYPQLQSAQDGISRFLVLETCVGVRPNACHAPFGLDGIYAGTLTANPRTPYRDLFAAKVASYRGRWEWLTVSGVEADIRE
ncbi:MAG: nucleotidyltransferase family protein [Hylemonella sp.]|nr:nucleotidyltransferase family protein [Hylemonella sp.]